METKEWGKPNLKLNNKEIFDVHKVASLDNEDAKQRPYAKFFRPNGVKQYKKIAGKRYRLPRKAKKRFKTNMCKHLDIKNLRFSYKRLNRDVDGNVKWQRSKRCVV